MEYPSQPKEIKEISMVKGKNEEDQ